jgi:hypothetical protein
MVVLVVEDCSLVAAPAPQRSLQLADMVRVASPSRYIWVIESLILGTDNM